MKTIKNMTLAVAAVVAAMFTACSDEQSTFSINDVPGRAVIQGSAYYAPGYKIVDDQVESAENLPVANNEVLVIVTNSDYDDNLEGQTTFTTVTDARGNYKIEIPASDSDMSVTVRVCDFQGRYADASWDSEAGEYVINKVNVIYGGEKTVTVTNHSIAYCNILCSVESEEADF